jgi:RNA polymerase sigma-70 factor (ECF subfamily)
LVDDVSDVDDGFAEMIGRARPLLDRYVRRRVEPAAVDDVVADVLLVAWRRRSDIPADRPELWLYATARKTIGNHRRSTRRGKALEERIAHHLDLPADLHAPTVDDRLRQAMAALAHDDREVLLLAAWEGLSHNEIAVVIGTSESASRKRLSRAKQRLQSTYDHVASTKGASQ